MTQEFDRLIKDATPVPPDCGPSRRAARTLLHDRMRSSRRRADRRRRWSLSLAAVVALALVGVFQIKPLGGDSLELDTAEVAINDTVSITLAKNKLGTRGFGLPSGVTDEDVYEIQQQLMAREGTIEELSAYSIGGRPPHWLIGYRIDTNGTSRVWAMEPIDLSVENHPPQKASLPFLINQADEFQEMIAAGRIPARPHADIRADGVLFRVRSWSREYPEWGVVTYYRGLPLETPAE